MKTYQLKINPSAESELKTAEERYSNQKENLGEDFIHEIEKIISKIIKNPKQFGKIRKDIRKAALKRFPYSVVYSIVDDTIELYSFSNHNKNLNI